MASQPRPVRGRDGNQPGLSRVSNQPAHNTHTPPPTCTRPCCAPPACGRGGNQRAQNTHTPPPPPPFTGPPAHSRRGYQRYGGEMVAGMAIGAVGAAEIISGYGEPAYGRYQNLPIITGVVATGTEVGLTEFFDHNGGGGADGADSNEGYGGEYGGGF